MFFDPQCKPEVKPEAKPDVYSIAGFVAWLEKQPAAMSYDWMDVSGCICCQYLADAGQPQKMRYSLGRTLASVFPTTEIYQDICSPKPWTAGAALKRARALL